MDDAGRPQTPCRGLMGQKPRGGHAYNLSRKRRKPSAINVTGPTAGPATFNSQMPRNLYCPRNPRALRSRWSCRGGACYDKDGNSIDTDSRPRMTFSARAHFNGVRLSAAVHPAYSFNSIKDSCDRDKVRGSWGGVCGLVREGGGYQRRDRHQPLENKKQGTCKLNEITGTAVPRNKEEYRDLRENAPGWRIFVESTYPGGN